MRFKWDVGERLKHPTTGTIYEIQKRWWKNINGLGVDKPQYSLKDINGGHICRGQERLTKEGWKKV